MSHPTSQHGVPQWSLSDRLRKIRRDRGLTQEQIAQALSINPPTWAAWESGRTRPHDVVQLAVAIENRYGVPASWTLGVLTSPDQSLTNPTGIPIQRPTSEGRNHGRRWDDFRVNAAASAAML